MSETIAKGTTGTIAPFIGIITSLQTDVEWWLRVAALVCGIAVSLVSFASICRKMRKDQ